MTFRHPLRNDWDKVAPKFEQMAKSRDRGGAIARVMLDIMPAFLTTLERERDLSTSPAALFDAIASSCGMMIENAVENTDYPRAALQRMLTMIENIVAPRVTKPKSAIILPEGFGS